MKKKIGAVLLITLLVGPVFSLIGTSQTEHYDVSVQTKTKTDDCGCDDEPLMCLSFEEYISLEEKTNIPSLPSARSDLPTYFSWRDVDGVDWTTPAKDQGNCGSCWDFAAIGALESIIQIREGCPGLSLDLSEQYVLSCLHAAGSCNGGWAYNAYRYMKLNTSQGNYCNGIIPERCLPYQVNDDVPCGNVSPDWQTFLIPLSTYGRWTPDGSEQARNVIKTKIMDSGPVVATMLFTYNIHGEGNLADWGYTHVDPSDYYPYPGPIQGTNHQVVLVGWKDDPAIANGGYWIVKNSVSAEWGYDGFFNLEYGSLNIDRTDINWVEYYQGNFSNWPPVARFTVTTQGQTEFDASDSFDHEGSIVSYLWDFGDGGSATGMTVTHSYAEPGVYQASLTVTDNASNTDTTTAWVFIDTTNQAPRKPWLLGKRIGENDTAYRYTFWANDPDGDDVYYYLNWGDTYWDGGAVGWIGPYQSGEKVTLEKTWETKGNYTVRVKAADRYEAKSAWATLDVTMPVSYTPPFIRFLEQLLEWFPRAFPLLRYLLWH